MSTMSAGTNIKSIKQRQVVLLPFPFSDLSVSKKRPALVVSNNSFNRRGKDVVCCLITSNPKDERHGVYITNDDMDKGSLEFESKIKPYRLFTADKKVVYKVLGRLGIGKASQVSKELYGLF